MSKKSAIKPLVAAVGAAMATSLISIPTASADANPFAMTELSSGYMVAGAEGKCGEGKCGGDKAKKEGKCGEGKCGGDKAKMEGGDKAKKEGKCGEGKCGGSK
ncbi:MAG: hypothetical protein U9R74_07910 [Pseudomonadota bacterium]|nr:hypothetical protein [Pseudomonadota bacterium]